MDRTPLPAFIWTARPLEIPPALIELDPESDVRISNGKGGTGTMLAGDYIKELRETIARQADGFYTTQEASHILAEAVPGMNAIGWQSKFNEAWRSGVLIVRDGTTTKKSLSAAKVDYNDLVKDVDLDAWLKNDGAVHLFPRGKPIAPPVPAQNTSTTAPVETEHTGSDAKPWLTHDPRDPTPDQPWYTPARYFARQLVIADSTLLTKRLTLADKVSTSLAGAGIYKRGGKKPHSAGTVLKAFANVTLG